MSQNIENYASSTNAAGRTSPSQQKLNKKKANVRAISEPPK